MNEMEKAVLLHELKNFLDENQKLKTMPVKRKIKLAFLVYVADSFQTDTVYTEKEINEIINTRHTFGDPVTIRRELVEHGYLTRDRAGTRYERTDYNPTLEELVRRYG